MSLLIFLTIILFACFFQGIAGFGFALIAAPLALLVLDKFAVVSSLTIIGITLNIFLFLKIKQPISRTILIPLFLTSVIGMPCGIWILKTVPIQWIKIIAGSLSILFALIILRMKVSFPQTRFKTVIAGFFSGILQTSITMSGPPIVILLAGTDRTKNEMRKTLVTFFLWMNCVSLPFLLASGTLNFKRISFGFYAIPLVFLGGYLGNKVVDRIPQKEFKLLALVTVLISGFLSIYSGFTT
jgi:uncharacterized protein